jgi:holo-[acyl-carrier protein] synthase
MKESHIGVDIIEIDRVRTAMLRFEDRFIKRIFTGREIALCRNKVESYSVRFAGKEAAFKSLGTGLGISWLDVEILAEESGKPVVYLHGKAADQAAKLGLSGLEISLSHSKDYAVALVIGFRVE